MVSVVKPLDDSIQKNTFYKQADNSLQIPQVKVSKLSKVIKDLGYLLGMVFTTYDNYITDNYDMKKTDKSIINKIKNYCWKRIHSQECIEKVQRGSAKSFGASILKNKASKSERPRSRTSRPETGVSGDSKSSSLTKTMKTENKTEKTGKDSDEEKESNGETSVNPTTTPNKSPVEKAGSRKTKIRFEDDAYKVEKFEKTLDANLFMGYLTELFEEDEELMIVSQEDHDNSKQLLGSL